MSTHSVEFCKQDAPIESVTLRHPFGSMVRFARVHEDGAPDVLAVTAFSGFQTVTVEDVEYFCKDLLRLCNQVR